MVLYGTDFRYLSIVSKVSQRVRLSTPSIYAPAHVKWSLLLIVVVLSNEMENPTYISGTVALVSGTVQLVSRTRGA